jgi:hypothetical protein
MIAFVAYEVTLVQRPVQIGGLSDADIILVLFCLTQIQCIFVFL